MLATPCPGPRCAAVMIAVLFSCLFTGMAAGEVPQAEHVIVIIMENHSYDEVRTAPYTASLIAEGTSFSDSYGVTHPSQPNYLALWSGSTQGVTNDDCPPPGSQYTTENLGHACEAAGLTWRSYCENLPYAGYGGCSYDGGLYHRRHAPWVNFDNLNHLRERPFTDLAVDLAAGALPALSFVIPNNCHNTHDCSIATGDAWLADHVPSMLAGLGAHGLLILTWDEDDHSSGNHILTVFAGGLVRGGYVSSQTVNHYTVLRAICEVLRIAPFANAQNEPSLVDVWQSPAAIGASSGGSTRAGATLGEPFPNPSRGSFEALLRLPDRPASIDAALYDARGARVAGLLEGLFAGAVPLRWNATGTREEGRNTRTIGPGVYFLKVRVASEKALVRKLTLLP